MNVRTKLLQSGDKINPTLLLDAIYLSLCIELAYDGTRELLVAVIGIAFVAGTVIVRSRPEDKT